MKSLLKYFLVAVFSFFAVNFAIAGSNPGSPGMELLLYTQAKVIKKIDLGAGLGFNMDCCTAIDAFNEDKAFGQRAIMNACGWSSWSDMLYLVQHYLCLAEADHDTQDAIIRNFRN